MTEARIAILGIAIESNNFAPPAQKKNFVDYAYLKGDEALDARVVDYWLGYHASHGFFPAMSALRPWTPVPIIVADGQSSGPVAHSDYETIKAELTSELRQRLPVDAVYIVAHGAGRTTKLFDLDGDYFAAIRDIVGADIPIVATLDLHANLTEKMIAACDALIAQRTNPHVDSHLRAEDAARLIHQMIDGHRPHQAASRVPLLTPQVSQLTHIDQPLGKIIAEAEVYLERGDLSGVSILPGFSFADTPEVGFWIYGFGADKGSLSASITDLARCTWGLKTEFERPTLSVVQAIEKVDSLSEHEGPIILADIADNPGGGATGDTTWLLEAVLNAKINGGIFAPIVDADVVHQAHQSGIGSECEVVFNAVPKTHFSKTLSARAKVLWVGSGDYDSSIGIYARSRVPLGLSCMLEIGGNKIVVISQSQQLLGADCLEHFGIDVMDHRFLVAKSRGHFRAGFAHLVQNQDIFEVDATGLTTAALCDVPWAHITRPIEPLDQIGSFEPKVGFFPSQIS